MTLPVMDKAERRALIVRPARRRRWRRIAECYLIGLVFGPIISALVNHGHPHRTSAPEAVLVAVLIAALASCAVESGGYGGKRAAVVRTLVIVLFGSALFVLPRGATLLALGSPFTSWAIYVRWLIYAAPYPLVADLIRPGSSRAGRGAPLVGLVCLALTWPLLMSGMVDAAAAQTRKAIGAPAAMLLFVDPPAPESIQSATYANGTLLLEYGAEPLTDWPDYDRVSDDLDMVVFPVRTTTPCPTLITALADVNLVNSASPGWSCTQLAPGLWQDTDPTGDSWPIEKHGAYYVILIVGSVSNDTITPADLPALFRTIHQPDDAELAALGEAEPTLGSNSDQQNAAARR